LAVLKANPPRQPPPAVETHRANLGIWAADKYLPKH